MNETLKMMKTLLLGYEKDIDLNELITEYSKNLNPNILAYAFITNFGVIYQTSKNYAMLDEEDKVSYCLQELDKCLCNYDSNKQCQFITYFLSCYKNRLRMETEQLLTQKRYANYITEDIYNYSEKLYDEKELSIFSLADYDLTKDEVKHCELLDLGYTNKEIANILNISTQYVYKLNKKIGNKLLKQV